MNAQIISTKTIYGGRILNNKEAQDLTPVVQKFRWIIGFLSRILLVVSVTFAGYIFAGVSIISGPSDTLPYEFLSLSGDPVVAFFGTAVGTLISLTGISITAYAVLSPLNTNRTVKAVIASAISVGFGLAVIRFTIVPLCNLLIGLCT